MRTAPPASAAGSGPNPSPKSSSASVFVARVVRWFRRLGARRCRSTRERDTAFCTAGSRRRVGMPTSTAPATCFIADSELSAYGLGLIRFRRHLLKGGYDADDDR